MSLPISIYTECKFDRQDSSGTWASLLISGQHQRTCTGQLADTNANTLELLAVVEALTTLKRPNSTAQVFTPSQYVVKGVNEWLAGWVERGWTNIRRQPIANVELWQKLHTLTKQHQLTVAHMNRETMRETVQQASTARAEPPAHTAATPPTAAPALTYVLIAGSRKATPEMLDYVRMMVHRAHEKGHAILVGDNPLGVDNVVVQECRRLKAKMLVAGVAEFPRNGGGRYPDAQYVQVERDTVRGSSGFLLEAYTVRDRWMVDNSQHQVFVWDGKSRGTKAGYDYAVQRGKKPYLKQFGPMLADEAEAGHG